MYCQSNNRKPPALRHTPISEIRWATIWVLVSTGCGLLNTPRGWTHRETNTSIFTAACREWSQPRNTATFTDSSIDKQMVAAQVVKYYTAMKSKEPQLHRTMQMTLRHHVQQKNPVTKAHTAWFHSYKFKTKVYGIEMFLLVVQLQRKVRRDYHKDSGLFHLEEGKGCDWGGALWGAGNSLFFNLYA